jgi:hypothetical protein
MLIDIMMYLVKIVEIINMVVKMVNMVWFGIMIWSDAICEWSIVHIIVKESDFLSHTH